MQAYAERLQYEKEQLEQTVQRLHIDMEQRYSHSMEELDRTRSDLDEAVRDRDNFKYQLNDLQREHKRISDRLHSVTEQWNRMRSEVKKMPREMAENSHNSTDSESEMKRLTELNAQLRERIAALEEEQKSLARHSSEESVGRKNKGKRFLFSQSSTEEDSPSGPHSVSISELTTLGTKEGNTKRNLSASASNLTESNGKRAQDISGQFHSRLTQLVKEREKLSRELMEVHKTRASLEQRVKESEEEAAKLKSELSNSKLQQKAVHEEMQLIMRQKGVIVEKSTASYEQSVQLQTKLIELQAEKIILEKHRDVANKERDRVVTEVISLKKKLEAIKNQRHKDAKELATMRRQKDKALQELEESHKTINEFKVNKDGLEVHYKKLASSLKVAFTGEPNKALLKELNDSVEELKKTEHTYQLILHKMYGRNHTERVSSNDVITKLDALFQEKSSLLVEIDGLQHSVHKQNEDRIFELKQALENIHMERDGLQSRNRTLSGRVNQLEAEREKLRLECERLDRQCQEQNASLSGASHFTQLNKNLMNQQWEQVCLWERIE